MPAVREGRARPPRLPSDTRVVWVFATRTVNEFLGTNYRLEEVAHLPSDWLLTILIAADEQQKSNLASKPNG